MERSKKTSLFFFIFFIKTLEKEDNKNIKLVERTRTLWHCVVLVSCKLKHSCMVLLFPLLAPDCYSLSLIILCNCVIHNQ